MTAEHRQLDGRTRLAERLRESAAYLRDRLGGRKPVVGLVLGSGLGAFADTLEHRLEVEYAEIPHFPRPTVSGHAGRLVIGALGGVECVAMRGRVHLYEGLGADQITFPARTLISLGARTLIITNAAGGIRPEWEPGTLMLISDHINLTGKNPLIGGNDERLGPRFPDMTTAYDPGLRELARRAAKRVDVAVVEGVYAGLCGPSYETPAEIRMLQVVGGDAVGMSTVLEVIAARHLGARVLGISCITNKAASITGEALSHDEVKVTADEAKGRFQALVRAIIEELRGEVGAGESSAS